MKDETLLLTDKQNIWHPYTRFQNNETNHLVEKADGCFIYTSDGRKLFDGTSSWWSKAFGHNHPELNQAIIDQLQDLSHVMFAGITHHKAIELVEELKQILPNDLSAYFYSDSGSVAVEVALKLALQYQSSIIHEKGEEVKRTRFVTFKGDYHGDTWHTMAVSDKEKMHHQFHDEFALIMPQHLFISRPPALSSDIDNYLELDVKDTDCYRDLSKLLQTRDDIAGLIIEPIIQGASGMYFYHPDYLRPLITLAQQHGVLVIFDEIATGFGRTGKNFALDYLPAELQPDMLLLGKALTGGYLGLGLTIVKQHIAQQISKYYVALHGPTFMANPLACAVATQAVRLYKSLVNPNFIKTIENNLSGIVQYLMHKSPSIADVRVLGPIAVVEFVNEFTSSQLDFIKSKAIEQGIYLRPFGKIVYLMVPYTVSDDELDNLIIEFCNVIDAAISNPIFQLTEVVNQSYV